MVASQGGRLIASEVIGYGFRGVAEYIVFEKETVASNESFFQLAQPVDGTNGRPFELPRISDHESRFAGLRASRSTKPADSLSGLSGRRLVSLKDQPPLLLPGDARADLEFGRPNAANGLRRPGVGQARAGSAPLGDHTVRGEYIGGTLIGTPREMSRQAAPFRAARASCAAPVMHYSLSLEAGDGRKSKEDWAAMVQIFLDKMGFDHKRGAWASWIHRDTDHDHVHIVFLRSMGDGSLWNREFSARRAIEATAQIEREFGLRTHDRTPKREKRALTRKEKEFEQRLKTKGMKLNKSELIQQIDSITERLQAEHPEGYSLSQFSEALKAQGIDVEAYAPKGRLSGLKYARDGMWISGSTLGSAYSPNGLFQRGLLDLQADVTKQSQDARQEVHGDLVSVAMDVHTSVIPPAPGGGASIVVPGPVAPVSSTWVNGSGSAPALGQKNAQERERIQAEQRRRQAAANREVLGDLLDGVDEAFRARLDRDAAGLEEEHRVSVMKKQKGLAALLLQLPVHTVRVAIGGLVNFLIRLVERVFGLPPESLGRFQVPQFENTVDVPIGVVPPSAPRPDADATELKRRALALKAMDTVLDQACTAIEKQRPDLLPGRAVKDADVQAARAAVFESIEKSRHDEDRDDGEPYEPERLR